MKRTHFQILSVFLIAVFLALPAIIRKRPLSLTAAAEKTIRTHTDRTLTKTPVSLAAETAKRSVVGINNYQADTKGAIRLSSSGSGVIIHEKYILTNYHVVKDAAKITAYDQTQKSEQTLTLSAFDSDLDIAILYTENLNTPPASIGNSDAITTGEWALCIGNPIGRQFTGTVTLGIISSPNRIIPLSGEDHQTMIQTDAKINAGNSGGGLFNIKGQLIGIPTMKYASEEGPSIERISLAIPINKAKPLIEKVLSDQLRDE